MKRKNLKPYPKKKSILILSVGFAGLILAFALLFLGAILQNHEAPEIVYLPLCISFLPICIADIIFLLYHQPGIILGDMENQLNTPKDENLEIIENIAFDFESKLIANNFELLEQGYYYKKTFNFSKDYINYYSKIVYSNDISQTVKNEFDAFDSYNFKRNNKCFIIFIESNDILDLDLEVLSNISNCFISQEIISYYSNDTAFIVLYDKLQLKAYIIKPGKNKLSFYNACYKYVKNKLLK